MPNKMLIDAIHPEETRVVVLRDKRVEDFDFEAASKKPLRGNIYLAKVTRVEPSLQAAFVEYGGNRHGFLAFSEIHPDYYQIPQADRAALLADERARADEDDEAPKKNRASRRRSKSESKGKPAPARTGNAAPAEPVTAEPATAAAPEAEAAPAEEPVPAPAQLASTSDTVSTETPVEEQASLRRAIEQIEDAYEADIEAAFDNPIRDIEVTGEGESAYDAPTGEAEASAPAAVEAAPAEEAPAAEAAPAEGEAAPAEAAATDAEAEAPAEEKPKRRRRTTSTTAASKTTKATKAKTGTESETGTTTTRKRATTAKKPTTKKSDDGLADPVISDDEALRDGHIRETHEDDDEDVITSIGEQDVMEEIPERRRAAPRRQYKIQEVIKRRQILLVQVVKEERGTKGAALTTYLSLAGRYSVLMPNTDRGGGVSRKITDNADRKRLKSSVAELDVPEGMGIILRTAAASRTKTEIKRDFEYLLRLWESVRDLTLSSIAPQLVYEEGNLVKRAIRDLYNKEIDEVLVSGEPAYREAKDFMKMLMPSHAKNVKRYGEATPIFTKYSVEPQLDAMFSEQVTLPSKGYIVINPTEALVSIDVNSGRSTKESSIEDTALKTNLEAADEVARQLRLRDLAGLIVIDFIDMDEKRHNRQVEKRLKDALKLDRSRIQVGRISPFGLLEMSRQRIRQGMVETSMVPCEACGGMGHVRSTQSVALHCLRALEDYLLKHADNHVTIKTSATVALYILNQKRQHLNELEERFGLEIGVDADETLSGQHLAIVPGAPVDRAPGVEPPVAQIAPDAAVMDDEDEVEEEETEVTESAESAEARESAGERSSRRRRRRRRRGGGSDDRRDERGEDGGSDERAQAATAADEAVTGDVEEAEAAADEPATGEADVQADGDFQDDDRRGRRRRGRRGGRRHRREGEDEGADGETMTAESSDEAPAEPAAVEASATETEAEAPVAEAGETVTEAAPEAEAEAEAEVAAPEAEASEPAEAEAEAPAPEEKSDPSRPRRVGWWQRRSFF
ncbi:ribonuclease [Acuticoccus sediminis]|uniref:Ribonuclease E n=1 Tax=Acuticoccus sediminis TaxID=2184697 RepID=A0A8B2NSA3_9HYPH|nr:ribonuclease E/G [Acuticoccus sediminis]RAH98262.1 ribonuclease [Acuticoccus sediminis]